MKVTLDAKLSQVDQKAISGHMILEAHGPKIEISVSGYILHASVDAKELGLAVEMLNNRIDQSNLRYFTE